MKTALSLSGQTHNKGSVSTESIIEDRKDITKYNHNIMTPSTAISMLLVLAISATNAFTLSSSIKESNSWLTNSVTNVLYNTCSSKQTQPSQLRLLFTTIEEEEECYEFNTTAVVSVALGLLTLVGILSPILITNNDKSLDESSPCAESLNSDDEYDESSGSDNDDEYEMMKRKNKPGSGYDEFLAFCGKTNCDDELGSSTMINVSESVTQFEIKSLIHEHNIAQEKANELLDKYKGREELLLKNLRKLKRK